MSNKDLETKEYFTESWNAAAVEDALKTSYLPRSEEAYQHFRKFLPKNYKILEAGCGLGNMVIFLKRDGYNVFGVDYLVEPLKKVKAYDNSLGLVAADIQSLPYADGAFKAYLSFGVLEHFEHGPLRALREANRVLADDGIIVVSVPYPNLLANITIGNIETPLQKIKRNRFIRKIFRKKEAAFYKPPYAAVFSQQQIGLFFKQTGFNLMGLYPINHSYNLYSIFKFFRKNELGVETDLCLKVSGYLKRIFPWGTCLLILAIGRKVRDA